MGIRQGDIEKELKKCSKNLLIKIILDNCIGHPFNNLTVDRIRTYKKNEKLESIEYQINELDIQFDNCKDVLKRQRLLEKSLKLSEKYQKIILDKE